MLPELLIHVGSGVRLLWWKCVANDRHASRAIPLPREIVRAMERT